MFFMKLRILSCNLYFVKFYEVFFINNYIFVTFFLYIFLQTENILNRLYKKFHLIIILIVEVVKWGNIYIPM